MKCCTGTSLVPGYTVRTPVSLSAGELVSEITFYLFEDITKISNSKLLQFYLVQKSGL